MGILGIALIIGCSFVLLIWVVAILSYGIDKVALKWIIGSIVGIVLGVWLYNYDLYSPVEVTQKIIQTSEPRRYGIEVTKEESEIVSIKKSIVEATRFGAIFGDRVTYSLMLEE